MSSIRTSFTEWEGGLAHFGTKGMRWGQRRYQNPDGSLTPLGEERYGKKGNRSARGTARDLNKLDKERAKAVSRYNAYKAHVERQYSDAAKNAISTGNKSKIGKQTSHFAVKANKYKRLSMSAGDMQKKIIDRSLEKGYTITAKQTTRSVGMGKSKANRVLATTGNMVIGSAPGTMYKVKDNGKGKFIDRRPIAVAQERPRKRRNTYYY